MQPEKKQNVTCSSQNVTSKDDPVDDDANDPVVLSERTNVKETPINKDPTTTTLSNKSASAWTFKSLFATSTKKEPVNAKPENKTTTTTTTPGRQLPHGRGGGAVVAAMSSSNNDGTNMRDDGTAFVSQPYHNKASSTTTTVTTTPTTPSPQKVKISNAPQEPIRLENEDDSSSVTVEQAIISEQDNNVTTTPAADVSSIPGSTNLTVPMTVNASSLPLIANQTTANNTTNQLMEPSPYISSGY
eukprot:scaffold109884_cov35-Attheya_sp.AAC.1